MTIKDVASAGFWGLMWVLGSVVRWVLVAFVVAAILFYIGDAVVLR